MFGPGEYRPDPSEGITAPADLPQPEIVPYSRNDIRQPCPRCGHSAYRDKQSHRTLHDLGNLDVWCPRDLLVTYSQHYCTKCRTYFSADLSDLAPPGSHYTHRVIDLAVPHRGRRRFALPPSELAPVARPPRLCPLCHDPELGRGWGKKRRRRAWIRTSWTGPWRSFRAMWPPMKCMMVPSAFFLRSIIVAISAFSMTSSTSRFQSRCTSGPFWRLAHSLAGTQLNAFGHHDRWLGALSCAPC